MGGSCQPDAITYNRILEERGGRQDGREMIRRRKRGEKIRREDVWL
jgi:hypothetical protein